MIEKLLSFYKQKQSILTLFLTIIALSYLALSYELYQSNKTQLYKNVDETLELGANSIEFLLEPSFFDRAVESSSVSKEEDTINIETLSNFVKGSKIQYLYTLYEKDGSIYFTSSGATDEDKKTDLVTYYFDIYENPSDILKGSFKDRKKMFEEASGKWGSFRSVFIPKTTPNGINYILAADVNINYINKELHEYIVQSSIRFVILILVLFVLYFVLKKFTKKELELIQKTKDDLEETIVQRTKSLKEKSDQVSQLLDNAEEGFLSFKKDLKVQSEYSKECEKIFHKPIADENIAQLLYKDKKEDRVLFEKVMKDVFDEKINQRRKQVFLHLLQKEIIIDEHHIKVEYKMILEDDKLMLILTDITEKKRLEEKIELEKKTLKMIISVVSDVKEFKEMVEEYKEFSQTIDKYLDDEGDFVKNAIEYYRAIHTFKGNFAQKDLIYVVSKLHSHETQLSKLLKNKDRTFDEYKELLTQNDISSWIKKDIDTINSILDQNLLDEDNQIKISQEVLQKIEYDIEQILQFPKDQRDVTYEKLLEDVSTIRRKTLNEILKPYTKVVDMLAKRLDKKVATLQINGGDGIFVSDNIKPLIKSFIHVFRNSIDHGIEPLDIRLSKGKKEQAVIGCDIDIKDSKVVIKIFDDGKGIDIDVIKQKALEKNLYKKEELDLMSASEILMLIFLDTFSTKEQVSEISGRGIGLGAVKAEIEKLGGHISIETQKDEGSQFLFSIPLRNII